MERHRHGLKSGLAERFSSRFEPLLPEVRVNRNHATRRKKRGFFTEPYSSQLPRLLESSSHSARMTSSNTQHLCFSAPCPIAWCTLQITDTSTSKSCAEKEKRKRLSRSAERQTNRLTSKQPKPTNSRPRTMQWDTKGYISHRSPRHG